MELEKENELLTKQLSECSAEAEIWQERLSWILQEVAKQQFNTRNINNNNHISKLDFVAHINDINAANSIKSEKHSNSMEIDSKQ